MFWNTVNKVFAVTTLLAGLTLILVIFTGWKPNDFAMAFAIGWAAGNCFTNGISDVYNRFFEKKEIN